MRRTGKTTFLRNDLIPALQQQGALVIYVDLWSNTKVGPGELVHRAVRHALGFKFGFQLETLGKEGGATLAQAFKAVGREVWTEEVQPVVNDLLADNILMRPGHGHYDITDPYVKEIWRERQAPSPGA